MVSTLDTLPAVSLCRVLLLVFVGVVPWCYSVRTFYLYVCRGLCLSDGEPVPWCLSVCLWLWIGGRWDVLPVCEPVPWSVSSTLCQPVSLSDVLPVAVVVSDGEPVSL